MNIFELKVFVFAAASLSLLSSSAVMVQDRMAESDLCCCEIFDSIHSIARLITINKYNTTINMNARQAGTQTSWSSRDAALEADLTPAASTPRVVSLESNEGPLVPACDPGCNMSVVSSLTDGTTTSGILRSFAPFYDTNSNYRQLLDNI